MPAQPLDDLERHGQRVALECDVTLQLPDQPRRLTASSANISATGMFVRSPETQPAGQTLSFEMSLSRRRQPIRGEGEVVWNRQFNLSPELPAGMGIRFLNLEGKSERTVQSVIEDLEQAPTEDTERPRSLSGLTSSQLDKLHAYAGCAKARPERKWPRLLQNMLSRWR